jgi:hypothetical protein
MWTAEVLVVEQDRTRKELPSKASSIAQKKNESVASFGDEHQRYASKRK